MKNDIDPRSWISGINKWIFVLLICSLISNVIQYSQEYQFRREWREAHEEAKAARQGMQKNDSAVLFLLRTLVKGQVDTHETLSAHDSLFQSGIIIQSNKKLKR